MDIDQVPQEGNKTLGGIRKAMYAKDANGQIVTVASAGWEVEEIVTSQAVEQLNALTEQTRQKVLNGQTSTLEYWMYAQRMDVAILSQTSGVWQWRVRRHFKPAVFARLSDEFLQRYAHALGVTLTQLKALP
ncbi:MAG: hypothetical protein ACRCV6_00355 [Formosimonas sp.]